MFWQRKALYGSVKAGPLLCTAAPLLQMARGMAAAVARGSARPSVLVGSVEGRIMGISGWKGKRAAEGG